MSRQKRLKDRQQFGAQQALPAAGDQQEAELKGRQGKAVLRLHADAQTGGDPQREAFWSAQRKMLRNPKSQALRSCQPRAHRSARSRLGGDSSGRGRINQAEEQEGQQQDDEQLLYLAEVVAVLRYLGGEQRQTPQPTHRCTGGQAGAAKYAQAAQHAAQQHDGDHKPQNRQPLQMQ